MMTGNFWKMLSTSKIIGRFFFSFKKIIPIVASVQLLSEFARTVHRDNQSLRKY